MICCFIYDRFLSDMNTFGFLLAALSLIIFQGCFCIDACAWLCVCACQWYHADLHTQTDTCSTVPHEVTPGAPCERTKHKHAVSTLPDIICANAAAALPTNTPQPTLALVCLTVCALLCLCPTSAFETRSKSNPTSSHGSCDKLRQIFPCADGMQQEP